MSEPIKDGGPAFPESSSGPYQNGEIVPGRPGMTLRDYFAGQAMQGWLSSFDGGALHPVDDDTHGHLAVMSYQVADAMIQTREGRP